MRRTASEIINDLEMRVARLERQAHTMSKKDRARLDELQRLEDQDSLTPSQNKEYEDLVIEYRKTKEYKGKKASNKTANQIANTIVDQLGGGRKLQMFIGLKQLITESLGVTLVFPLPKHTGAVNRVRITLNGSDLYDMEFIRTRGSSQKIVKEFNNVFAEDLKDMFEKGTGLYIRF